MPSGLVIRELLLFFVCVCDNGSFTFHVLCSFVLLFKHLKQHTPLQIFAGCLRLGYFVQLGYFVRQWCFYNMGFSVLVLVSLLHCICFLLWQDLCLFQFLQITTLPTRNLFVSRKWGCSSTLWFLSCRTVHGLFSECTLSTSLDAALGGGVNVVLWILPTGLWTCQGGPWVWYTQKLLGRLSAEYS